MFAAGSRCRRFEAVSCTQRRGPSTSVKKRQDVVHTLGFHLRRKCEKLQVHSKSATVADALCSRLM